MRPDFRIDAVDGEARAGRLRTARGTVRTPAFMPVGTRGAVRHLSALDLERLGVEIVLANAYHLMLRPGAERIERLGGLHGFSGWSGPLLTDSGGYQVFSLDPAVDDGGATFRSTYDGSLQRLTPEGAVSVQARLGADVQMVLDVCPALPADRATLRSAVDRSAHWAHRARKAFLEHEPSRQQQFGIVQGGTDVTLRAESAERTVACDFDGYAVGGLSVGEDREARGGALRATTPLLPADQVRYLMGVGDPVGLVEAVAAGVDLFDCVLPTRLARHGTALSWEGRLNLKNRAFADDDRPIDPTLVHPEAAGPSRAYLRHLLNTGEPTAARLLTLHNLAWLLALVAEARAAVVGGSLEGLRSRVAEAWG